MGQQRAVHRGILVAATLASLAVTLPAMAQVEGETPPPGDAEALAREHFERGTALVQAGRFAEARAELESALALSPRPAIAFNLVVAERGMGALVAASRRCRELLAGGYGALDAERRPAAESLCAEVQEGLAHVEVHHGSPEPAELRIDGVSLGTLAPASDVTAPIDPGSHVLALLGEGRPPLHREITLDLGEHVRVELALPPRSSDEPFVLGLAIGGATLVVGVVVAVVAVVVSSAGSAPAGDLPVTATLTFAGQ